MEAIGPALAFFGLVLARILPVVFLAPFLGGRFVPAPARVGVALVLAAFVFPTARPSAASASAPAGLEWVLSAGHELARGTVLGLLAALLFWAVESAGRALDVIRGANQVEAQLPAMAHRVSPLANLHFQLTLVVFCRTGGDHRFIEAIVQSFEALPLGAKPWSLDDPAPLFIVIVTHWGALLASALGLVLPGICAALLVDVVFGVFSRIAPSINAYFLALGTKSGAVLGAWIVAIGVWMAGVVAMIERTIAVVARVGGG